MAARTHSPAAYPNSPRAPGSIRHRPPPLARRVCDLRHTCVSTWLNGGVAPAQVAGWAGHSAVVLLRVYAKCIDGQDPIAKRRIEDALREPDERQATDNEHGAT
jgi:hypothetical protein